MDYETLIETLENVRAQYMDGALTAEEYINKMYILMAEAFGE